MGKTIFSVTGVFVELTWEMIVAVAGGLGTIGATYLTIKNIIKNKAVEKEAEKAAILQEAKEYTEYIKKDLENKIVNVQINLDTVEQSVAKDLAHLRETYNGEIRNLGTKIEELRSELRNQHGQLVQLLTKMISSKD